MIKKILRKDIKLSLLNIRWCRIMQGVVLLSGLAVNAQNPIIQTSYTADPAPMVYNDKLYLYTSHDEDGSTWFTMNDWKLYSTDDMVNWTEHPTLLSFKTFEWAGGDAWAAQCIERDGKFYMYVPVTDRKGETAIGVAVADSPYGPFYDPIGAPLGRWSRCSTALPRRRAWTRRRVAWRSASSTTSTPFPPTRSRRWTGLSTRVCSRATTTASCRRITAPVPRS